MVDDVSTREATESTAFILAQLGFHTSYRFADALAPLGIGPRQFGTLRLLRANNGQTQHQLSTTLGIHRNVMVGLVDDLEARELVERRRHPTDRRAHAVHLLPAGAELLERAEPLAWALDESLQESLSRSERADLRALLDKIVAGQGLTPGIHPGLRRGAESSSC